MKCFEIQFADCNSMHNFVDLHRVWDGPNRRAYCSTNNKTFVLTIGVLPGGVFVNPSK